MQILKREYNTMAVSKIKGYDKLDPEQTAGIDKCDLTRFIVLLDENEYTVNEDGEPEMTKSGQEEYDGFVDSIRRMLTREEIRILDEGYGEGEDELEWHITGGVVDPKNGGIAGIFGFETCVRAGDLTI